MIDTNHKLSNRFFFVNNDTGITPSADNSRMIPMSRLIAMSIITDTNFRILFDDSGVDDQLFVQFDITSGKGKEVMKDIVDAMNSNQRVVTLADRSTGESITSHYDKGEVEITGGVSGTFALSGALTVAGNITSSTTLVVQGSLILSGDTKSSDGDAVSPSKPVTYLAHDGDEAVTLADSTIVGRNIIIISITDNTVTLTPANTAGDYTTIAFTNIGESVTLMWTASGWAVLSRCGGGTAAADAVATMPVLA